MHPIVTILDQQHGHKFDVLVRPSGEVVAKTHTGRFVGSFMPQPGQSPGHLTARLVLRMEDDGFVGVDAEQVFDGLQWFAERGIDVTDVRAPRFGERLYLYILLEGDNVPVRLAIHVMLWAFEVSRPDLLNPSRRKAQLHRRRSRIDTTASSSIRGARLPREG